MSASRARKRDVFRNFLRLPSRQASPSPTSKSHPAAPSIVSHPPAARCIPTSSVPVSQRILDAALDNLSPAQRTTLQEHGIDGTSDVRAAVDEAYIAASNKKQQCDDKKWRWRFQGREVVLRDEAEKVMLWMDRFKSVGDIAANAAPVHAGLPWAGIRMILEVINRQHSSCSSHSRVLIAYRLRCLNIAKWPLYSSEWTLHSRWPTG